MSTPDTIHFHRDLAMVLEILGEIDRCHAARAKFFLDGAAVGQGSFEALQLVAHLI